MTPILPTTKPGPTVSLFGRANELERARGIIADVTSGAARAKALLVSGPPGVGKTRVTAELRRELRAGGHPIFECNCSPDDDRAHGPMVDVLASAAKHMQDVGERNVRINRALNFLTGYAGSHETPSPPSGDAELFLCETVRQAFLGFSTHRPTIFFFHDVHFADDTTLRLIRYILENFLTDPVFDWTPPEASDTPGLGEQFSGLFVLSFSENDKTDALIDVARATAAVEHIPLSGLNKDGVRAFLASDAVVQKFIEASHGLPLALEHLVDLLPVNPGILWGNVVAGLDEKERSILDALAIVQGGCTHRQLIELANLPEAKKDIAERLVQIGLIRHTVVHGRPSYAFARAAERIRWKEAIPPERKRALHLALAEKLAAGLTGEPEQIARHFLAAGAIAEAVPYTVEAADRLAASFAHQRAAQLLAQVVQATEGALRGEILDRLAILYTAAGQVEDAQKTLEALQEADPSRAGPDLEARYGRLLIASGQYGEARRFAASAIENHDTSEHSWPLRAIAADAAYREGDLAGAQAECKVLEDAAVDHPHPALLELRNTLGKIHLFREQLDDAEALFESNLEWGLDAKDEGIEAKALINLGVVHLQRGNPGEALAMFERARECCSRTGDLANLSISLENLAVLHHRRKEFSEALAYYHQSSAASRRLNRRNQLTTTALNLADLYLTVGDQERAQRLADIAEQYVAENRFLYLEPQLLVLEGDLARAEDNLTKADEHYAQAMESGQSGEVTNQRLGTLLWARAELKLEQNDHQSAAEFVRQAMELPSGQSESLALRLRLSQGGIYIAQGACEKAETELEAAVHASVQAKDPEMVWQTSARLAEARWRLNNRSGTLNALTGAVEMIERVAAELPVSLRDIYRETPRRRAVRAALRRVKAGLPPEARLDPRSDTTTWPRPKTSDRYKPYWSTRYGSIIGRSPALFGVFNALDRVSGSDSMVLIRGESGTGKELVAAALHQHSPRAQSPFVKVNCAAFVETLLLSELFGHEKGAFTGAVSSKKGRFELAHGGTLFLDEVGDISPNTQVALLRVLQEKTFERVGGSESLTVDVRVICATHRNLEKMVDEGLFRADLYYRLRGVIIELPALRERRGDVPLLAQHFLRQQGLRSGKPLRMSRDAYGSLIRHDWPGNVRELENVIRSVSLFADGDVIGLVDLAELGDILQPPDEEAYLMLSEFAESSDVVAELLGQSEPEQVNQDSGNTSPVPEVEPEQMFETASSPGSEDQDQSPLSERWLEEMLEREGSLADLKKRIEFEAIAQALHQSGGNITRAAEKLGMKRPRLSQIIQGSSELGDIKKEASGK